MNTKKALVEAFVRLSMQKEENATALRGLLSDKFQYKSPLSEFNGVDSFFRDPWAIALAPIPEQFTGGEFPDALLARLARGFENVDY